MNADTSNSGMFWLCVGIAFLLGLFVMAGGGDAPKAGTGNTTNTTSTTSEAHTQVNVFSLVNNNNGRQFSNDANTTQATVNGDHAQFSVDSAGNAMCWNPDSQQYVYSPCPQAQP